MICLSLDELKANYKKDNIEKAFNIMRQKGYSPESLLGDKQKQSEIVDAVVANNLKHKEDVEIFAALNLFVTFFNSKEGKICFPLIDSVNLNIEPIRSIKRLKEVTKENSLTDFAIWYNDGLRQFQLKQYKGKLTTDDLFDFISNKLLKYGNNLGNVNFLIIIQGDVNSVSEIDFNELNNKISDLKLKYESEILIYYNEENKFNVVNQVYPGVKTRREKINANYLAGRDLYSKAH